MSAAAVAAALRERDVVHPDVARPTGRRRHRLADGAGASRSTRSASGRASSIATRCRRPTAHFPASSGIESPTARRRRRPMPSVMLECSDLDAARTSPGLDAYFLINIDHHLGNEMYGARQLVRRVGGRVRRDGRRHHRRARRAVDAGDRVAPLPRRSRPTPAASGYGPISARTFEICRRIAADRRRDRRALAADLRQLRHRPRQADRRACSARMELHHGDRLAVLAFDDALLAACGATIDDTEGLVNLPLGAREVRRGRAVQAPGGRHVSRQPALQGRRRRARRRRRAGAAAGTRTPPAARSPAARRIVKRDVVAALEHAIDAARRSSPRA